MPDIAEQFGTGAWKFTPDVVQVFDAHVHASVPFYDAIQDLIAEASDWLVPDGGLVADLGASTGTTATRIIQRHPERKVRFVLYDQEPAMLEQARGKLESCASDRTDYVCARIQDPPLRHTDADLTLLLFTLQFLTLQDRVAVLRMARLSASETGALIIAEKLRPADPRWLEISNDVSHDWKAGQGVTDAAIRAKARALRGVLNPCSQATLLRAIQATGWQSAEVLFRWHSWVVIGAFAMAPAA